MCVVETELPDLPEPRVNPALPERKALQALLERQAPPERTALLDLRVWMAKKAQLERPGQLALKGPLARRALKGPKADPETANLYTMKMLARGFTQGEHSLYGLFSYFSSAPSLSSSFFISSACSSSLDRICSIAMRVVGSSSPR